MARRYTRDARGRFASGGFSGQTGGRGARLMSGGRSRAGGGARIQAAPTGGTFRRGQAKPAGGTTSRPTETTAARAGQARGPRLQGVTRARLSGRKMSEGAGLRGKRRQERQQRMAIMDRWMAREGQSPSRSAVAALARKNRSEPLTTGGGTLAARGSLRRSRAKLRQNDTPSQRGAVTRASRYTGMAIKRERVALGQSVQGRFVRGKGRRTGPEVTPTTVMGQGRRQPRIADTLRESMRALAQSDARFYRALERDFGIKIPTPTASRAKTLPPPPGGQAANRPGKVSTALREGLRSLAQADARRIRDIQAITRDLPAGTLRGSGSQRQLAGSRPRLGPSKRRKR